MLKPHRETVLKGGTVGREAEVKALALGLQDLGRHWPCSGVRQADGAAVRLDWRGASMT